MRTQKAIAPLTTEEMTKLIGEGRASEIVTRTQAYNDQQKLISEGKVKRVRRTIKLNKADGLYIAHPAIAGTSKGGLNYSKHLIPVIEKLVQNEELFNMVRDYFINGTVVDEHLLMMGE